MSDKLGGYTESDVTPYTEEERALSLAAWAFDLLTEKSTLREALMTVKVHRYEATLHQVEAERDALIVKGAELEAERNAWKAAVDAFMRKWGRDYLLMEALVDEEFGAAMAALPAEAMPWPAQPPPDVTP